MSKILKEFEKTIDVVSKLKNEESSKLIDPIHEGKWSIREIVGHLYYWDKYNLEEMVPKMADGADLPPFPDLHQHNDEAISYLKDHSVESVINDFVQTRRKLIDNTRKIEGNVRFTIGKGKRKFSPESFIGMFLKHDIHHIKQINEKLNNK